MSSTAATLKVTLRSGADFIMVATFKRDGVATQVDNVLADVRTTKDSTGNRLLRISVDTYLTQPSPGQLVIQIPESVTETLAAGSYFWDMFGTVNGQRIKLVDTSAWVIIAHVTTDSATVERQLRAVS